MIKQRLFHFNDRKKCNTLSTTNWPNISASRIFLQSQDICSKHQAGVIMRLQKFSRVKVRKVIHNSTKIWHKVLYNSTKTWHKKMLDDNHLHKYTNCKQSKYCTR